ncbi:MAG: hypothetical protein ABJB17_04100 [Burkholderiales bacterium]
MNKRLANLALEVIGIVMLTAASANASAQPDSACIPPVSYLPLDGAQVGADRTGRAVLGSYERISPDGRFVLRSWSGGRLGEVSLIELPADADAPVRVFETPLSNEAFPVQGSWRYLVDVNGDHYRFTDVLAQQRRARPLFRGGMTGFYAVASELAPDATFAGSAGQTDILIRSLSWPQPTGVAAGGAQGGSEVAGTGPLQVRTLRVVDDGQRARAVQDTGAQYVCTERSLQDGNVYALPMLSIDGTEFSAVPQAPRGSAPSMRVYGLANEPFALAHVCDQRLDLGFSPAKAVFGFPPSVTVQAQRPDAAGPATSAAAPLVYTHDASVYWFDRAGAGVAFRIDDLRVAVLASAFPGLTRDGRVIFGATWKEGCTGGQPCVLQAGYVVADPLQNSEYRAHLAANPSLQSAQRCITVADVQRERERFAAMHRLSEPKPR